MPGRWDASGPGPVRHSQLHLGVLQAQEAQPSQHQPRDQAWDCQSGPSQTGSVHLTRTGSSATGPQWDQCPLRGSQDTRQGDSTNRLN